MTRPTRDFRVGDRVHRVRGHHLANYRPTGWRGTVTGFVLGGRQRLAIVLWDGEDNVEAAYHPSGLEPLSAVEQLGELGGET